MRFRVLGPVEIESDDGRVLPVPRRQERCVLAVLLLEVGRMVPVERLCALLWDDEPPEQARRAVQVHVARIRAGLARLGAGAAGVEVVSHRHGYLIRTAPDTIDAHRFRALCGEAGRTADPAERDRLLRAALALWRGPALQGTASDRLRERLCADLEEQRLQAIEALIATGLDLGRHEDQLPELARLTAEHPDRERLAELSMRALHAAGRTVEALDVYTRFRVHLAERFGLDPGPDLQRLHQAVLRGEPAVPELPAGPVPAQLPRDSAGFTGRDGHLRRLQALLPTEGGPAGHSTAVVIAGTAGVGKTALAVHWAHRVRDRFPDGQLYVNLRGYAAAPPMRPIEALSGFLTSLGVPADQVPLDVEQAAGRYRSLLAGRRMLVVLDNARSADQVRPLLPADGGCLVLITSRHRLGGLVARDDVHRIDLDVLTPQEAQSLLARIVGASAAAEPDAVARLAEICAHLPLALRIAAANLLDRPDRRIAEYVGELAASNRLTALSVEGDDQAAVLAAFDLSYDILPADAQRLFRRLGLAPGPDVTAESAAVLGATTVEHAAGLLRRLAGAHLLTEHAPGRYTFHDLLRAYAAERAEREDGPDSCAEALQRLYDHYLGTVRAAVDLAKPESLRLPPTALRHPPAPPDFADSQQAMAWLDAERANLVAAVTEAARRGPRPAAWLIADALRSYFWLRLLVVDWVTVARAGLAAAVAEGPVMAQAAAEISLGDVYASQGLHHEAIAHVGRAMAHAREAGWLAGEAAALNNLGVSYARTGQLRRATRHYRQALDMKRRLGNPAAEATSLMNVGTCYDDLGRPAKAVAHHARAAELYRETGSGAGEAYAVGNLGVSYHILGRLPEAVDCLTRGLALARASGNRDCEIQALCHLAAVRCDTGEYQEAADLAGTALKFARDAGSAHLEPEPFLALGAVQSCRGEPDAALESYRRALESARRTGAWIPEIVALTGLATTLAELTRTDEAREHAEDALRRCRASGYRLQEGNALNALAGVELAAGDLAAAADLAQQATAIHRRTGHRLGEERAAELLAAVKDAGARPLL